MQDEDICALSYQELRERCKASELSTRGSTKTLQKRLLASLGTSPTSGPKRPKRNPADDMICPITHELPWDPVTAEDGRVYEKEAIKRHIRRNRNDLRSPLTNERMGERLFPSPFHRYLSETLVENGNIDGELATAWRARMKDEAETKLLLESANRGDSESMYQVAENHFFGMNGFKKSSKSAIFWYKKAHTLGNVKATSGLAEAICKGWGVKQSDTQGVMYTAMAAAQGSDYAARRLGFIFANGKFGVDVNKEEAIRWLDMAVNGNMAHQELDDEAVAFGQRKLNLLLQGRDDENLDDDEDSFEEDDESDGNGQIYIA